MSDDRDLADAIHDAITSDASVAEALDVWRSTFAEPLTDNRRMRLVLSIVTANAIDRALARRQREAARTGPWESTGDAADREAADAAEGKTVHSSSSPSPVQLRKGPEEEDGYPGSLLPPKRDTP